MKLTKLAGPDCDNDDCPAVFISDRGTIVVQGDGVSRADGLRVGNRRTGGRDFGGLAAGGA